MTKNDKPLATSETINWYPGHMAKAWRLLVAKGQLADLIIVVLDARAPLATFHHKLITTFKNKALLLVLAKKDLADLAKYPQILNNFELDKNYQYLLINLKKPSSRRLLLNAIKQALAQIKRKKAKQGFHKPPFNLFIVGVPNVGKSTLINLLRQRKKVAAANIPGITKNLQWIRINDRQQEYNLLDTPGLLWPKLDNQNWALQLLMIGSLKQTLTKIEWLAQSSYQKLSYNYPKLLAQLTLEPATQENAINEQFNKLATNLNFKKGANQNDLEKTYWWFLKWLKNLQGVTYE